MLEEYIFLTQTLQLKTMAAGIYIRMNIYAIVCRIGIAAWYAVWYCCNTIK
jgi:hypothetical protein